MEEKVVTVICLLISLKLLLIFCYYSTDFEVHRNWLAVTYSLPYQKWYYENTSIWTLDYPPYFGWFEYCLSQIGAKIDAGMVKISQSPYAGYKTVVFQRLSVVFTDLLYICASVKCVKLLTSHFTPIDKRRTAVYFVVATLLITNGGLLLVDSIHFQYNGMLFGILLLSVTAVFEERYFLSALSFAILLNFKHIFAYIAPAYVVFLLKNYCFSSSLSPKTLSVKNCAKLALALSAAFGFSLGPFLYNGQFMQILSRLFPFKRGLTHAYWAPNFWALYNFVDLISNKVLCKFFGRHVTTAEYTSGMVQEFQHTVLPNVSPMTCLVLTLTFILPFCVLGLADNTKSGGKADSIVKIGGKKFETFLKLINLCAFSSYMFGWHVHEKAILMCILPLNLLAFEFKYVKIYILSVIVGIFSLFPLFFTEFESILKYCIWILYCTFAVYGLQYAHKHKNSSNRCIPFLNFPETLYVLGFFPLEIYCSFLHGFLKFDSKFKFLPLLLTSVYCSFGILYVWLLSCWQFLCDEISIDTKLYRFLWKRRQISLKSLLKREDTEKWQFEFEKKLKFVAGLDISTIVGDEHNAVVCLVILQYPSLEVILIDGNGYLHPRKFGLACYVGISLDMCTIGVSKNFHSFETISAETVENLKEFSKEENTKDIMQILDNTGEVLAIALKPNENCKNPIYVSIGHKICINTAVRLVKKCSLYRIPEPTRQADIISRQIVQEILS